MQFSTQLSVGWRGGFSCIDECSQIIMWALLFFMWALLFSMWALLFFTSDAGLLARSQYSEGPTTGHLDTGFSLFPCA